jgi:hypothetical protein
MNHRKETKSKVMIKLGLYFLALVLVINFLVSASSSEGKKTYSNNKYKFTFDYPSSCNLKRLGKWSFDLFSDGKILLRGNVEDDTIKIFIKESKPQRDIFISFSRERAKIVCGADGPDGSSYCQTIKSEREYTTHNGLYVLEFYLTLTREGTCLPGEYIPSKSTSCFDAISRLWEFSI